MFIRKEILAVEQKTHSAKLTLGNGQASFAAPNSRPQHKPLGGITAHISTPI